MEKTVLQCKNLTFLVRECNKMQKSNNEFLLSFCRRVIMWCPENGMSHRKREIKERSIKVEVIFSGNESIIRWKE